MYPSWGNCAQSGHSELPSIDPITSAVFLYKFTVSQFLLLNSQWKFLHTSVQKVSLYLLERDVANFRCP